MTRTLTLAIATLAILLLGCENPDAAPSEAASGTQAVKAAQSKTVDALAEKAGLPPVAREIVDPQGADHGPEDCAAAAGATRPSVPGYRTTKGGQGETIFHAGAPLTNAPKVTIAALLERPDAYVGKTVTLEGDLSAMCHHKRGWFALAAADKSGKQVRVLSMPAFKVPPKSIGRSVVVEGVVEQLEVSARMARHLAVGHRVGEAKADDVPVKRVVLRAKGGSFADMVAK